MAQSLFKETLLYHDLTDNFELPPSQKDKELLSQVSSKRPDLQRVESLLWNYRPLAKIKKTFIERAMRKTTGINYLFAARKYKIPRIIGPLDQEHIYGEYHEFCHQMTQGALFFRDFLFIKHNFPRVNLKLKDMCFINTYHNYNFNGEQINMLAQQAPDVLTDFNFEMEWWGDIAPVQRGFHYFAKEDFYVDKEPFCCEEVIHSRNLICQATHYYYGGYVFHTRNALLRCLNYALYCLFYMLERTVVIGHCYEHWDNSYPSYVFFKIKSILDYIHVINYGKFQLPMESIMYYMKQSDLVYLSSFL